jgi:putative MATE family efflux protein
VTADIKRDLWQLAWPAVLAMVVHHLFRINVQYFVEQLGVEAQAAVSVGSMFAITMIAFGEMVGIGTLAIAARRFGEGRTEAGHATIRRGLRLGMLVGAVLSLAVLAILPSLAETLVPGEENALERRLMIDYVTWIAGGQVVMLAVQVLDQSFLALKDTRTSLYLQVLAVLTNATLNAILIPWIGIEGAGAATVASRLLVLVIGVLILRARGVGTPFGSTAAAASAWRILRIGVPACIAIGIYSIVYLVMLANTFVHFDAATRTALGIGFGVETIFYCLYWGVGTALSSLVARYLGERNLAKATAVSRLAIRTNVVIGFGVSLAFVLFGEPMVGLLTQDPAALAVNEEYLLYMAIAQPFQAAQVAFDNVLIGAGRTLPIMITSVVMNLLRVPLAHVFAILWGFGLPGIWWAINASSLGKCLGAGWLYRDGKWMRTEV